MDKIIVQGGTKLNGEIFVSGSKNAALPIMAACLLSKYPLILSNIPRLADISTMIDLLKNHGVNIDIIDNSPLTYNQTIKLTADNIITKNAPYEIVKKMRASVLVLGPLLARFGEACVSLPGGCAIGTRPIDLHLSALEQMGADIFIKEGYIYAKGKLQGANVNFEKVSVGATENILLAATLAQGRTILKNAAAEPEVIDLAQCLVAMGAKITGIGTSTLIIDGVGELKGANHSVIPDRIEAGTYAVAVTMTGGEIEIKNINSDLIANILSELIKVGAKVTLTDNGIKIYKNGHDIIPINITTDPYPGFPTDMQAQFMALMCIAKGKSIIHETIFENRFMHAAEMNRMGANIIIEGNQATVTGVKKLIGAPVMASDLRASVSLILAGLVAEGETEISRVYHLDRGYEKIEEKLGACGAKIKRIP